jgi:tRNA (guanine-N7-)-methyltransferase
MRLRHKKNLEQRLKNCGEYLLTLELGPINADECPDRDLYLNFRDVFNNDNPVMLEIGCGKGRFICEAAMREPDKNFLAVEKAAGVIVNACERAREYGLSNVRFIMMSAEYLYRYIPAASISGIYLNFSCPFPKNSYRNHRLTSERFLNFYRFVLKDGAVIRQKTDSPVFFEFSVGSYTQCGFTLKNITHDLHNSVYYKDNIKTEYEEKFASLGKPVYALEAFPNE